MAETEGRGFQPRLNMAPPGLWPLKQCFLSEARTIKLKTLFAVATLLFAASLTAAGAQNSAAPSHRHHKHHATAPQAKPAAAPRASSASKQAPAPFLAPLPALPPPPAPESSLVVAYKDGALAITAQSATLREIFEKVHECTGAVVEAPALDESVSVQLGPEPPADAIAALLEGLPL